LGYQVSLETSGAFDIKPVDTRVKKILDIKTPGSGEAMRNRWENLHDLTAHDEVKLVLTDRVDYEWAKTFWQTIVFLAQSFFRQPLRHFCLQL